VVLLAGALLIATCGIGVGLAVGQRPAIRLVIGFEQGGPATTADVVDVGVPIFTNRTGLPIRLHQITFAVRSFHVRLVRVIAFRADRDGYISATRGDLVQHCHAAYQFVPVTNVVIPPHADTDWEVMVVVRFDAPGRYQLAPVRITYAEAGRAAWQQQNLNTTMVISAARPGQKPEFDGC
jgi:hypothetical protein